MQVFTFNSSGPAAITVVAEQERPQGPKIAWNDGKPTTGYWKKGDMVKGIGATAALLYLCTAEGNGSASPLPTKATFVTVTGA
jgi:hypothetical protein